MLTVRYRGVLIMEIPLPGSSFVVGSDAGNDLRLALPGVLPHHLVLRRRGRRWFAMAGDRAGVMDVQGRTHRQLLLAPGTAATLGDVALAVQLRRAREETAGTLTLKSEATPRAREALELRGTAGCRPARLELEERSVTLGRDATCDMVLDDPFASLQHARIVPVPGAFMVVDLGSRNGTRVNGRRVDGAELGAGVRLSMGRTTLECVSTEGHRGQGGWLVTPALKHTVEQIDRYAHTEQPLLITGETGCGKEGLARRLHHSSPRHTRPFVPVNCAALPESLADSLLFGHARGAFTGAEQPREGLVASSHGGTLFLDEIGELSPTSQARLLRVLEEGSVRPVGDTRVVDVDLRVVAATHRDLEAMVRSGEFRLDLFHRLAVFGVWVPPLRERRDDVELLARHLLKVSRIQARSISRGALRVLREHTWPGNVRELKNVLLRAALNAGGGIIRSRHVVLDPHGRNSSRESMLPGSADEAKELLAGAGYNISQAARALGVARSTLRGRLKKLGVSASAPAPRACAGSAG